ncbi:unnamed protein product, partial [Brassica oleracea var. botrytis]
MVRLTIWDNQEAYFRELNRISTRKHQIVIITSIIPRLHEVYVKINAYIYFTFQGNYHSQPHLDRASTLTTILISYNASKRRINCYPKHDVI